MDISADSPTIEAAVRNAEELYVFNLGYDDFSPLPAPLHPYLMIAVVFCCPNLVRKPDRQDSDLHSIVPVLIDGTRKRGAGEICTERKFRTSKWVPAHNYFGELATAVRRSPALQKR